MDPLVLRGYQVKIISMWQPWASLWVTGEKVNETRSWGTSYRGRIAVHAAQLFDDEQRAICRQPPFAEALTRIGFTDPDALPRGAILGAVEMVSCQQMTGHAASILNGTFCICPACLRDPERAFGRFELGRFAWSTGVRRLVLPKPIPWRGAQGLRDLPIGVL